ncbi:hypothetical protein IFM89_035562 [Coptis chinensis]|uniref:BRCT domain-containing protein n=1 Tax=Coptis chinensis TaxID=261450 RepID=A0A835HYF2_9MAGN|nr:hypothetical protein IFM89_035562 [Coptis chinensis]
MMPETSIIDSDDETHSPSSSDDDENGYLDAVEMGGETELLNFEAETEKVDYLEGSDKTEVLSDGGDCEQGVVDQMRMEKGLCGLEEEGGMDYVGDSDTSDDEWGGFAQRSSISVLAASTSGRVASQTLAPKETTTDASSLPDSSQSRVKHFNYYDGVDDRRGTMSVGIEVKEGGPDNNSQNCNINMTKLNDEVKFEDANLSVGKHFEEDKSSGYNGLPNVDNYYEGTRELVESPACDHKFARLSYVDSQEPGEHSQQNALAIVDRFLSVTPVEPDKEDGCLRTFRGVSPPVSRKNGTLTLAKRSGIKSPARDLKIFDWVDSYEDEGRRGSSDDRNETSIRSRCLGRIPLTQTQKPRYLSCSKARWKSNSPREREGNLNLHQKITGSTSLETGLVLQNSKLGEKMVQTSDSSIVKNLTSELDEEIIDEPLDSPLEETDSGIDLPDAYDIGFDTQVAAEAMEALCCGAPANQDSDGFNKLSGNATCGTPAALKNSGAMTKHVYVRNRLSSDSGGTARRSKRTRKNDRADNVNCSVSEDLVGQGMKETRLLSLVKKKSKRKKIKTEERPNNGISVNRKQDMGHSKTIGATKKVFNKDYVICNSLTMSADNVEVSEKRLVEENRTFSPIACRTRRSRSVQRLKGLVLCNQFGEANDLMESRMSEDKRRRNSAVGNVPKTLTTEGKTSKPGFGQNAKVRKSKLIQKEPSGFDGAQEDGKSGILSYSMGKRTCGDISSCLKGINLGGSSTVGGGQDIPNKYILRRKRSKIGLKSCTRTKSATEWGWKTHANTLSLGNKAVTPSTCTNVIEIASPAFLGQKSTLSEAAATPLKGLKKRRDVGNVRVLFSHHLDDDIVKHQKKISSRLGISVVSTSSEATHFIADKFVRTRNMLEAIAFGKPVVTHLWLESCTKSNFFVDEQNYILRDLEKEKEIGFSMPVSLARARTSHSKLLKGKRIFITPSVKPSRELVESLVVTVHGQVVKRLRRFATKVDKASDNLLILSCEDDYAICVPFLENRRAAVYSSELLLNGIVIQNLEYERHLLFKDHGKRRDGVNDLQRG